MFGGRCMRPFWRRKRRFGRAPQLAATGCGHRRPDRALLALEGERHAKAGRCRTRGHRCHDGGTQMGVQLFGRDHDAGPGPLHLAAHGRVQLGQPNLASLHHQTRESPASLASSGQTSASPHSCAKRCASSAQASRGWRRTTSPKPMAVNRRRRANAERASVRACERASVQEAHEPAGASIREPWRRSKRRACRAAAPERRSRRACLQPMNGLTTANAPKR